MSITNPNSNVLEILEQVEWFSYDDLEDLVYFLQGIQLKMIKSKEDVDKMFEIMTADEDFDLRQQIHDEQQD